MEHILSLVAFPCLGITLYQLRKALKHYTYDKYKLALLLCIKSIIRGYKFNKHRNFLFTFIRTMVNFQIILSILRTKGHGR